MNGRSQAFPLQISLLTPAEVFAGISAEGLNKEFKFDLTIFPYYIKADRKSIIAGLKF